MIMTSIRMLTVKEWHLGLCAICRVPAILKWRDYEIGCIGDCCHGAVILADKSLQAARLGRPEGQVYEK